MSHFVDKRMVSLRNIWIDFNFCFVYKVGDWVRILKNKLFWLRHSTFEGDIEVDNIILQNVRNWVRIWNYAVNLLIAIQTSQIDFTYNGSQSSFQ
jgi:hypothetical protein